MLTGVSRIDKRLFPLSPGTKIPLKGSQGVNDAGKIPFSQWPDGCNVGYAMPPSVGILDFDGVDGQRTLNILKIELGMLPESVATLTPNGQHYWFRVPSGFKLLSRIRYDVGVDVLAKGRYAVIPPSQTDAGTYAWIRPPSTKIAALHKNWQLWLTNAPSKKGKPALEPKPSAKANKGARFFSEFETSGPVNWSRLWQTLPDGPGQRNSKLPELCQELARYFNPGHLDPELESVLRRWHNAARQRGSGSSYSDTKREFVAMWSRTCWSLRTLAAAWQQTSGNRLERTAQLCGRLGANGEPFVLGTIELGRLAECSWKTANRMLMQLQDFGLISMVEDFSYRTNRLQSRSRVWRWEARSASLGHSYLLDTLARQTPKQCDHCGLIFEPARSTARFCSSQCRNGFRNEKRKKA